MGQLPEGQMGKSRILSIEIVGQRWAKNGPTVGQRLPRVMSPDFLLDMYSNRVQVLRG